jgi:hypothetical protein
MVRTNVYINGLIVQKRYRTTYREPNVFTLFVEDSEVHGPSLSRRHLSISV